MIISNIGKQYLVLKSQAIKDFTNNIGDYSSVTVSGNLNCDKCPTPGFETIELPLGNVWVSDLNSLVLTGAIISSLNFYNQNTGTIFNVLTSSISLATILDDCVNTNCTLETRAGTFISLFKTPIDTFFANNGFIGSNVSVSFTGNTVQISNLPTGQYIAYSVGYSNESVPFYYSSTDSNVLITGDSILVAPGFFGLTDLTDNVYSVTVRLNKGTPVTSWIEESNCAFIDILMNCKVASVLQNIVKEMATKVTEKVGSTMHLLHYSLINGSNCGCNCNELCEVFRQLDSMTTDYLNTYSGTSKINGCGCI